jgi:TP901 family phage tail tape measure protein
MADDLNMQVVISAENSTSEGFNAVDDAMSAFRGLIDSVSAAFEAFTSSVNSGASAMASAIDEITAPIENTSSELSSAFEGSAQAVEEQISQISGGFAGITEAAQSSAEAMAAAYESGASASEKAVSQIRPPSVAGAGVSGQSSTGGAGGDSGEEEESSNSNSGGSGEEEEQSPSPGGGGGTMGSMGLTMAGGMIEQAIRPVKDALSSAIDSYAQFDQSMRMVNTEAKLSQDGFKGLSDSVLDLSNQTGLSADDLSKGLYNVMARGGIDAQQGMVYLKSAADGAKAGMSDLNTTTTALNSVMGAYGMSADQANHIMDVMFTSVNNGQEHFTDLAKSVGASATSAATAGVSYEELAAAQATLTNVGKDAQVASQGLNAMITGMMAPSAGATKEANSLGIEWDAAALKAHGLSYMINEAMTATGGNTDKLKELIPNQRAFTAELALGGKASEQYKQTLDQMKNSSGATAAALAQVNQGAGTSIADLKTQLTNAGIELGESLAPGLAVVANAIEDLIHWFDALSPSTKEFIGTFAGMLVVVGSIVAPILMFVGTLGMLAAGLGVALGPILGIVAAIIGFIALAALVVTHWNEVTDFFKKWGVDILAAMFPVFAIPILLSQHWGQAVQIAEQTWGKVTDFFKKWGTDAENSLSSTGKSIVNTLSGAWDDIKSGASSAWDGIGSDLSGAWSDIKTKSSTAWTDIQTGVVDSFEWMYNHNYYFKDLVDYVGKEWDAAKQDATEKWNDITSWLGTKWNEIETDAENIWGSITTFFSNTWAGITSDAQAGWNAFATLVESLWNDVVNDAESVFNPIENFFSNLWNSVSNDASTAWTDFKTTVSTLAQDAYNGVTGIFDGFENYFGNLAQGAYNWGANLIHMIANGISDAASDVENAVSNIAGDIASFLGFHSPAEQGPGADADTWAPNLIKMFASGLTNGAGTITAASNSLMQSFRTSMTAAPVMSTVMTGSYAVGGTSSTNTQNNDLLQAISNLTTAITKITTGSTSQGQNVNIKNTNYATVRNDNDLQQLQRSMYNSSANVNRALGIRG